MSASKSEELDALFRRWRADSTLYDRLIDSAADLINAVVNRKLRGGASVHDIEDVCSEALLDLLSRLDKSPDHIADFPAYVASIGYHAVHDYFRRRHPERHKLNIRLRYALKAEYGFALWDAGDAGWLASLERYRQAGPVLVPDTAIPDGSLADAAARLLEIAKAPVPFDALVDRLTMVFGIHDQQVPLEDLPVPAAAAGTVDFAAAWTHHLERLWAAIADLPVAQRVALLLNLRSDEGGSPIQICIALGTTSISKLAALLELEPLDLARVWSRLPLADQEIADRFGITRQQVINLRMSARKRLARNLPEVIKQLK